MVGSCLLSTAVSGACISGSNSGLASGSSSCLCSGGIFGYSYSFPSGYLLPIVAYTFEISLIVVVICLFCESIPSGSFDAGVSSVVERRVLIVELFVVSQ